jgi:hydroxymethylpyrimidine kinase/phosphomethylpyrimidine kinase
MKRSQGSIPIALTIAGSDSGGGAGIQADLKTFAALGTHGTSAITCLTAQNPKAVLGIHPCASPMVRLQIEAVFAELPPAAVKTGMLYSEEIIRAVAASLKTLAPRGLPLIIDPVMVATSGARLLKPGAIATLKRELFPLATLVTPNIDEAEILIGRKIASIDAARAAAREIHELYGCAALVKGGHLRDSKQAIDFFHGQGGEWFLEAPFIKGVSTHGTGCTYSAAITACCARGMELAKAVAHAKEFITQAIAHHQTAARHSVLNFFWKRTLSLAACLGLAAATACAQTPISPDKLLLEQYRPHSIYKIPQTRVEKARFPVVDMHSHAYAKTEANVEQWIKNMDAVGLQKTVVMLGSTGKSFDDAAPRFMKHPARFEVWCGIDFTGYDQPGFGPAAIAELERCRKAGAVGVGELSDKGGGLVGNSGGMHMDDPRMDAILEKCADLGLPVNIHVGEDRWMYEPMDATNDGLMNAFTWRIVHKPGILEHDEVIATLDRAVKKHPRTTFIACHFANCCYDLSKLAAMLDRHPNLYADIGARMAEIAPIPRNASRFFDRYQDRLFYGTDMGTDPAMYRTTFRILETEDEHFYDWNFSSYHWSLNGLGLNDDILKKLYSENATKLRTRLISK